MRAYLNGDWRVQLPEDLNAVIVPVDKLTNNVGETQEASSVTTTSDSLWLLSFAELAGPIPAAELGGGGYEWAADIFNAEGTRYKLFNDTDVIWDDANSVLVEEELPRIAVQLVGAFPSPDDSGYFWYVGSGGPVQRRRRLLIRRGPRLLYINHPTI